MEGKLTSRQYAAAVRFAFWSGSDKESLINVLRVPRSERYRLRLQRKRSGGFRQISVPIDPLKELQRIMVDGRLRALPVSDIAHGSMTGRSIISHIVPHLGSRSLLSMDFEDAVKMAGSAWCSNGFNSLGILRTLDIDRAMLEILKELTGLGGALPQGAPTSPMIFNYLCSNVDRKLIRLAEHVGGTVTRYVDNVDFSMPGPTIDQPILNAVPRIIYRCGFEVNRKKTSYLPDGNREGRPLRMLGLNLQSEELKFGQRRLRHLRLLAYGAGLARDTAAWRGICSFCLQVEGQVHPQLASAFEKGFRRSEGDPLEDS